jgi:superfamily II DNA or RNA helicase
VPRIANIWTGDGNQRRSIQPIKDDPSVLSQFNESFMIRTRLNADLDYIVGDVTFPKQLGQKKKREAKFETLKQIIIRFGLKVTRISDAEVQEKNDPFIIHRVDVNPFNQVLSKPVKGQGKPTFEKDFVEDDRWSDWSQLRQYNQTLKNPFVKPLYELQLQTLEKILRYPGSLTIAALPTGFGKTRIAQAASYMLRKNHIHAQNDSENIWSKEQGDCGPTLIISPLVALMDDQRSKWNIEFNKILSSKNLDPLNCRFLTTADLEKDASKMEQLRNNQIDVLCCSPEDLMDPKRERNHWLETFARMEVPFSLMVVDEAHIIGSWGATIRPQFQLLSLVKDRLLQRNPNLRVLLMSATISLSEERELIRLFSSGLHHKKFSEGRTTAIRKLSNASRPELYFDISYQEEPNPDALMETLLSINNSLTEHWNKKAEGQGILFRNDGRPSPILIYTPYPDVANKILRPKAIEIISGGEKEFVKTYTGQTSPLSRELRLEEFIQNKVHAMIATSAFGMGVDKPDTWVVAYYGMPYSLSDLYQGFGRAARQADWNKTGYRKSGYCLGILHGRVRSFKPRMGLALTTERFWDMLNSEESFITNNGYIVLDISDNVEHKYWETTVQGDNTGNSPEEEEDNKSEVSEGQLNDIVQELISQSRISVSKGNTVSSQDNFDKIFKENYSQMKKIKELLSLRLWSIACLQRVGKIEILGFHPSLLFKENESYVNLKQLLEKEGYQGIIDAMVRQGKHKLLTPKSRRMVVLRVNDDIDSFDDIVSGISEGLSLLKDRHNAGKEELQNFLDIAKNPEKKGCFRQLFSKTIGLSSEKPCIEQIKSNIELGNGTVLMPCSRCRKDQFLIERGLGDDIIMQSKFKVLKVLRDGLTYSGERLVKEVKKKSLIINRDNCTSTESYDLLDGEYKLESNCEFQKYSIYDKESEYKLEGQIVISGGKAVIKGTDFAIWDNHQFLIAEPGEDEAKLAYQIG